MGWEGLESEFLPLFLIYGPRRQETLTAKKEKSVIDRQNNLLSDCFLCFFTVFMQLFFCNHLSNGISNVGVILLRLLKTGSILLITAVYLQ